MIKAEDVSGAFVGVFHDGVLEINTASAEHVQCRSLVQKLVSTAGGDHPTVAAVRRRCRSLATGCSSLSLHRSLRQAESDELESGLCYCSVSDTIVLYRQ